MINYLKSQQLIEAIHLHYFYAGFFVLMGKKKKKLTGVKISFAQLSDLSLCAIICFCSKQTNNGSVGKLASINSICLFADYHLITQKITRSITNVSPGRRSSNRDADVATVCEKSACCLLFDFFLTESCTLPLALLVSLFARLVASNAAV